MLKHTATFWIAFLLLGVTVLPLAAQGDCPAVVQQALLSASQVCSGLARNQVCYGNNHVEATDWQGAELPDFAEPGSVSDLLNLAGLATFPFDTQDNTWGVALLAVQADLPDTLPGQNVTLVVFGDMDLQNDVPPDGIAAPTMLAGTANSNPNLRLGPGTNFAIAGSLSANDAVTVIGQDAAGEWLQLLHDQEVVWVAARFIQVEGDVTTLPVADPNSDPALFAQPMQAFRIRPKPGKPSCEEVPQDGLLIQAPTDTTVNFLVNGIEMKVGSTALLRPGESDAELQVATLGGSIGVTTGGEERVIEPGFIADMSAGSPPPTPERYQYDEVRSLPLGLLPELPNIPPPDGREISVYTCFIGKNGGTYQGVIPSDKPLIFGEAFGGVDAEAAQRVRENTSVTLTIDGEPVPMWSISDPYSVDESTNAGSGQQTGAAVVQKWWFVVPQPEPGEHVAVATWHRATIDEYRCAFRVE
jgi:hypothetical protein